MVFLYAVLSRFDVFKEKPAFSAIVAFVLSIMAMLSPILVRTINLMAPWLVLFIILIVILLLVYQTTGVEKSVITGVITGDKIGETFSWVILIVVVLIFVGSLTTAISEQEGFQQLQAGGKISPAGQAPSIAPNDASKLVEPGSEREDFFKTIFHPKVLGIIVIMLIGVFAIQRLSAEGS